MKKFAPILLFCVFAFVGLTLAERSWNGQIFVYVGEPRSPAAVRSLLDYSSLDRRALYRSASAQLMVDAQVFKQDDAVGVQLGHPLLNRQGGGKAFSCQVQDRTGVFDHIELTFIGTGISEAGTPARMLVTAPCHSLSDINRLETVWIPMRTIMTSTPKDQELEFFGDRPVMVRLEEIPHQWPRSWVLWNVRLYAQDRPDESLTVDAGRLKEARPALLSFDWAAQK